MNELHQILAELETNLKDLESAKNQVKNIATKSDDVNNSTKQLIVALENFIDNNKDVTIDFDKDFKILLENFKKEIKKFIIESKEKTNKENEQIKELTKGFINSINNNLDDFNNKSEQSFINFDNKVKSISSLFVSSTKEQTTNIDKIINSVKNLVEKQETEFNNLKQDFISEFKKQNKLNFYLLIGIILLILTNIIITFIK